MSKMKNISIEKHNREHSKIISPFTKKDSVERSKVLYLLKMFDPKDGKVEDLPF